MRFERLNKGIIIKYDSKRELKAAVNGFIDADVAFDLYVDERRYSILLSEGEWNRNRIMISMMVWLNEAHEALFKPIREALTSM